jgi:hypothetical protein
MPRHEAKNPTIHLTLLAKLRDGGGGCSILNLGIKNLIENYTVNYRNLLIRFFSRKTIYHLFAWKL